jgi:hypothetical protein
LPTETIPVDLHVLVARSWRDLLSTTMPVLEHTERAFKAWLSLNEQSPDDCAPLVHAKVLFLTQTTIALELVLQLADNPLSLNMLA